MRGALVGRGRIADVFAFEDGAVVKLFGERSLRAAVEQEATNGRLAREAGIPVPATMEVIEVDGRPGIVYERVHGPSMLAILPRKPWKLFAHARRLAELHVAMHAGTASELPAQRGQLRRGILAAKELPQERKQAALAALDRLPDGHALCHGDFHPDNVLMPSGGPVIIDWATAARGNPVADVALTSLILRLGDPPPGTPWLRRALVGSGRRAFHDAYLRRYAQHRPMSTAELVAWQFPVAAARLGAGIPRERRRLLQIIDAALCAQGARSKATQPRWKERR